VIRKSKWKGYTALVLACFFGIFALWNGVSLAWRATHGIWPTFGFAIGHFLRITVVCYCAFIAYRHLGPQPASNSPWQSAGWARIFIGTFIIAVSIKSFVYPSPTSPQFQPSNDVEAAGAMFAKAILIPALGLGLVVWGGARAFTKTESA
jgi:hypothetical protein